MDLKMKKNFISILLVASLYSSCFKSDAAAAHANEVVGDNSSKTLKNKSTINLTTYQISRELPNHAESLEAEFQNKSNLERDVVTDNKFQWKAQVSAEFPRDLVRGSTPRKSRSHRGRIRITNNTKENFQMKFPEGFSPSIAPYHPLLYPFATDTPPSLQVNDPWKPIKYSETTTISPFNEMKDDDALSPTQLDSLRETIIYGLPKLNSRESVEQEADFGTDIRIVKPLNLISRKESSVISDDGKFKSLIPEGVKIDLLRQSIKGTAELIQYSKDKEIDEEKINLKNTKNQSFTVGFNKSRSEEWVSAESRVNFTPASTELNADYRRLNQTTWPPSSSEEKILYDSAVSDLPENRIEIDDSTLDTPKMDSYINNDVIASESYHTVKLRQPFIDHTTKSEPTICIPMYFKETTATTGSEQFVNVERVYCFPFPPEFKINFNGANEPATVEIAQEEWLNNELISNGNRFTMNIILLVTAWMVLLMTKRLQRL